MVFRRYFAVMLCTMALSGIAQAQTQGDSNKGNSQQQNSQTEQAKPKPAELGIGLTPVQTQRADQRPTEAKVYEPDCGKPQNKPDADLCVQRRVADAAESALHWTQIQTVGALIGLVLVLATLGVTAWTGKAASVAAQAAVDAVGAERAWMSFVDFNFSYGPGFLDGKPYNMIYAFSLLAKNTGRSPALRTAVKREAQLVLMSEDMPTFTVKPDSEYAAVVGPGIPASCQDFSIAGQDLTDFRNRKKYLAYHMRVEYETVDAPGVIRVTETSGRLIYMSDRSAENGKVVPYFNFLLSGQQNTAT